MVRAAAPLSPLPPRVLAINGKDSERWDSNSRMTALSVVISASNGGSNVAVCTGSVGLGFGAGTLLPGNGNGLYTPGAFNSCTRPFPAGGAAISGNGVSRSPAAPSAARCPPELPLPPPLQPLLLQSLVH